MRRGLARTRSGLITALDVGSTKVCAFIARADEARPPQVIGIGQQASRGLRSGAVIDLEAMEATILNVVHAAEQMAGLTVDRVMVNLSGGQPTSATVGVEVALRSHEVNDEDIGRALAHGHSAPGINSLDPKGRELIHSIPLTYNIDGETGIRDPRGMFGEHLGVNMHLVTVASGAVRNLTACVERCHLEIDGFVVSPYAAGLAALVEDEMNLGVTVIDMGGGTTSIAVFHEGNLVFTDVVPVGGQHVTNDIARGLSTPLAHAERLKTLYGHAIAAQVDERHIIDVPQVGEEDGAHPHQVPRSLLVGIIQPRLEETFELVRSQLELGGFDKLGGRRVVLTGGASQLTGVSDLAQLILDKQVRLGRPGRVRGLAEATGGPAFAVAAGLLVYALAAEESIPLIAEHKRGEPNGFLGRFGHWFRENF